MLLRKSLTAFPFSYISGIIERKEMKKYTIKYYSNSDGQIIEREFDPNKDKQQEFVAKTGNLCRVYWDTKKDGYRTATNDWIVSTS